MEPGRYQGGKPSLDDPMNNLSKADQTLEYTEIITSECFLGEIPFDVILESIESQFDDYINSEDDTNYVDVFYTQLAISRDAVEFDEEEVHVTEIKDALDQIEQRFNDFMQRQFSERLTISISVLEDEDPTNDDVEFIFRKLYEFFILNAKKNFKDVIERDIVGRIPPGVPDDQYYIEIERLMTLYTPLISGVKSDQFLQYRGDQELIELFEEGEVTGNFLRKYTPKLYENDEFKVELINYITMCAQLGKEITDGE